MIDSISLSCSRYEFDSQSCTYAEYDNTPDHSLILGCRELLVGTLEESGFLDGSTRTPDCSDVGSFRCHYRCISRLGERSLVD